MVLISVADPLHFGTDPDLDPAIFVIDLQDANKKLILKKSLSAYYFLKVHLHHFSKIKSHKEVTKQRVLPLHQCPGVHTNSPGGEGDGGVNILEDASHRIGLVQ